MDLIIGAHAVAAVLLTISGPRKLSDPAATAEFLAGLGVPINSRSVFAGSLGRAIGLFEIVLGMSALAIGGGLFATLVGVVFLVFALLTWTAMRRGVGSCACFGRSDSPPTVLHVLIDLALAAVSFGSLAGGIPLDLVEGRGAGRLIFVVGVGVGAGVVYRLLDVSPGRPRGDLVQRG